MPSAKEIQRYVAEFVDGKMSLDEFEDWSARSSWNIHKQGDPEAQDLAYLIRSLLNERLSDQSEASFREELANAIRPFADKPSAWERIPIERGILLLLKNDIGNRMTEQGQTKTQAAVKIDVVRKQPASATSATRWLRQVAPVALIV